MGMKAMSLVGAFLFTLPPSSTVAVTVLFGAKADRTMTLTHEPLIGNPTDRNLRSFLTKRYHTYESEAFYYWIFVRSAPVNIHLLRT